MLPPEPRRVAASLEDIAAIGALSSGIAPKELARSRFDADAAKGPIPIELTRRGLAP